MSMGYGLLLGLMWYVTACCMQDWQESSLCPSPAAADLSKDIPAASCVLLMSPLHQLPFAPCVNAFEMCVSNVLAEYLLLFLVKGSVLG